jgi:hypothetical protein
MVSFRRLSLLLAFAGFALLAACGGSDSASPSATAVRSAPTRVPARVGAPTALLDPNNGPPGTEVTVTGAGWPARGQIQVIGDALPRGEPYATVTANEDGTFTAKFRLEKQPSGSDLKTGRFNLIARSGATDVELSFNVETRRPVDNLPGGGGG